MILWAVIHEVDGEFSSGRLRLKHAVFTSRDDAEWFLLNYPDCQDEPSRWYANAQGSVNW